MASIMVDPRSRSSAIPAETLALNARDRRAMNAELRAHDQEVRRAGCRALAHFRSRRIAAPTTIAIDGPATARPAGDRAGQAARHLFPYPRRRLIDRRKRPARWCWSVTPTMQGSRASSLEYRLARKILSGAPDDCEAPYLAGARGRETGSARRSLRSARVGGRASLGGDVVRLRDRHKSRRFSAALLNYGCFDLGMTRARALGR